MMDTSDTDPEFRKDLLLLQAHQQRLVEAAQVISNSYRDISRIESKYNRSRVASEQLSVQNLSLRTYRHKLADVLSILKSLNEDRLVRAKINRYIDETLEE